MLSGKVEETGVVDAIHPMKNLMDQYHAEDPKMFPRTNRNAYMIDPREHMQLERALKKQLRRIKVIYHSHPDVGTYFSAKDKDDAMWGEEPRYPDMHYLVCGIKNKQPDSAILVSFNPETRDFEITHLD